MWAYVIYHQKQISDVASCIFDRTKDMEYPQLPMTLLANLVFVDQGELHLEYFRLDHRVKVCLHAPLSKAVYSFGREPFGMASGYIGILSTTPHKTQVPKEDVL